MATQTDPTPEEVEDDPSEVGEVDLTAPQDDKIIIEGGGTTPITPADNQLLGNGYQEDEDSTGSVTPSGVVTESLSQMKMDSPASAPTPRVSNPPCSNQET